MAFLVFGVFVISLVSFIQSIAAEVQILGLGFAGEDVAGAGDDFVCGALVTVGLGGRGGVSEGFRGIPDGSTVETVETEI